MKKLILALIMVCLLATAGLAAERKKEEPMPEVGRYQIVPVEYKAHDLQGSYLRKAVLKIDTTTGKTWVLQEVEGKIGLPLPSPNSSCRACERATDSIVYYRRWIELEDSEQYNIDKDGNTIFNSSQDVPETTRFRFQGRD